MLLTIEGIEDGEGVLRMNVIVGRSLRAVTGRRLSYLRASLVAIVPDKEVNYHPRVIFSSCPLQTNTSLRP